MAVGALELFLVLFCSFLFLFCSVPSLAESAIPGAPRRNVNVELIGWERLEAHQVGKSLPFSAGVCVCAKIVRENAVKKLPNGSLTSGLRAPPSNQG